MEELNLEKILEYKQDNKKRTKKNVFTMSIERDIIEKWRMFCKKHNIQQSRTIKNFMLYVMTNYKTLKENK